MLYFSPSQWNTKFFITWIEDCECCQGNFAPFFPYYFGNNTFFTKKTRSWKAKAFGTKCEGTLDGCMLQGRFHSKVRNSGYVKGSSLFTSIKLIIRAIWGLMNEIY